MRAKSFLVCLSTLLLFGASVYAQTTAFTYQGRLTDSNANTSGTFEMRFKLFDALTGGAQQPQPTPVTLEFSVANSNAITVTNGIFTVLLDFGPGVFTGAGRWLEIEVRNTTGPPAFTLLAPRQQITSSPYATRSSIADNALKLQGVAVSSTAPAPNQVLKFIAGQWQPGPDVDTTYTAGSGLLLSGTQFLADLTTVQSRVSGACAGGTAMTAIAANGTPTCSSFLPSSGGTLTGSLNLGTNALNGTTAVINFTNFDVASNGNTAIGGSLSVAGNITLNTGGAPPLPVTSSQEQLRIYRGAINGADGSVLAGAGTGFASGRISIGRYQVVFGGFTSEPTCVGTVRINARIVAVEATTTNSCTFQIYTTAGTQVDSDFNFVAIGPR
jgi:hypothetical protein